MYVCMYVCMYVYIYIYVCGLNLYALFDNLFLCGMETTTTTTMTRTTTMTVGPKALV